MRSRKPENKPLSFSTTMRNPNRIVSYNENLDIVTYAIDEFIGKIQVSEKLAGLLK